MLGASHGGFGVDQAAPDPPVARGRLREGWLPGSNLLSDPERLTHRGGHPDLGDGLQTDLHGGL